MPSVPELLPLGLDGVLIRFATRFSEPANRAALALAADLQADPLAGQAEVAAGLGSVLLRFDRGATHRSEVMIALQERLSTPEVAPAPGRHWTIPACFGGRSGAQLAEAAALAGRSETALVAELCSLDLRVLALGFAPGQPYLGTLPEPWQMPRLPNLTPRVEAGTITTAIRQIVLFAAPSPTGWRALGRCAFRPFAPGRPESFLLRPGDSLRFVTTAEAEILALEATGDPLGGAVLELPK